MATLDLCHQYFGTRDIYELFAVSKEALPKDIKKAYYKLSLQVHPDRVKENEKEVATEKFKLLSKLYQVLTDQGKRALYDEQGIIENDDLEGKLTSWLDLWKQIFKPITTEDISNYQKSYVGSDLEHSDIKKAYLSGKGCINHMMNDVPFLKVEDEPRLQEVVKEMIAAGEVPEYSIFTKEPAQKRNRRHKKYARESKEAEEIKQKLFAKSNSNLEQQIMARQTSRESSFNSLMDKLSQKYGNEDESDVVDFDSLNKNSKKKNSKKSKKQMASPKLNRVKSGKVKKRQN